jgi:D-sedoheptulose 7-phosphate isomerase
VNRLFGEANLEVVSLQSFARTYLERLSFALDSIDSDELEQVARVLIRARDEQRTIFICGNGGSAARASHFASDLNRLASNGSAKFRAIALTDNLSLITALANDEAYSQIFVRQLENLLTVGDLVVAFTCSGNSENVVAAIDFARQQGATTVGVLGGDGGRLKTLVDVALHVDGDHCEIAEDVHAVICHILVRYLSQSSISGQEPG